MVSVLFFNGFMDIVLDVCTVVKGVVVAVVGVGPGRPAKRASGCDGVGLFFRVDPRLKNLLLDISDGFGISLTELLLVLALKEAGLESLDEFAG